MKINYGQVPQVLLLGNGINRTFDSASWTELIKSIQIRYFDKADEEIIKNIPYPMQAVVLTGDNISTQMKKISSEMSSLSVGYEKVRLLRSFIDLPFDTILTTNYTYELEQAMNENFKCLPNKACKFRKTIDIESNKFSKKLLHTYFQVKDDEKSIWHIHGEAARPDTMILGHYFYGKEIAKIQEYIAKFQVRYNGILYWKKNLSCKSWIDYFMLGDVYIVGLGLDLSEMDLWWLINCKKRHFKDTKITLYKPDITKEQELLANAYGVIIEKDGLKNQNYRKYYEGIYKRLKKKLVD